MGKREGTECPVCHMPLSRPYAWHEGEDACLNALKAQAERLRGEMDEVETELRKWRPATGCSLAVDVHDLRARVAELEKISEVANAELAWCQDDGKKWKAKAEALEARHSGILSDAAHDQGVRDALIEENKKLRVSLKQYLTRLAELEGERDEAYGLITLISEKVGADKGPVGAENVETETILIRCEDLAELEIKHTALRTRLAELEGENRELRDTATEYDEYRQSVEDSLALHDAADEKRHKGLRAAIKELRTESERAVAKYQRVLSALREAAAAASLQGSKRGGMVVIDGDKWAALLSAARESEEGGEETEGGSEYLRFLNSDISKGNVR